jgi:hypothetical protein
MITYAAHSLLHPAAIKTAATNTSFDNTTPQRLIQKQTIPDERSNPWSFATPAMSSV